MQITFQFMGDKGINIKLPSAIGYTKFITPSTESSSMTSSFSHKISHRSAQEPLSTTQQRELAAPQPELTAADLIQ